MNRHLGAKYPHRRKVWRTTIWKVTGIRVEGTTLLLARARGLVPIRVCLPAAITRQPSWMVREVRLVWDRAVRHYTWHLVVENGLQPQPATGTNVMAVDLGEIHPAVCTDGEETVIISARCLRSTKQYTAKRLAEIQQQQAGKTKGSRRHRKLQRRKRQFLGKQRRRVRDIEHKVSRAVVDVAKERAVGTIALGDVRDVADGKRLHAKSQQKVGLWSHGRQRQYITYKAEAAGIQVELVDEAYSSQTCPNADCTARHKPKGRIYLCPVCGFQAHRDAVGAANLLSRFRTGKLGQIRPPPDQKYRRPAASGKRSMRSRLDTADLARGYSREAAGL